MEEVGLGDFSLLLVCMKESNCTTIIITIEIMTRMILMIVIYTHTHIAIDSGDLLRFAN